MPSPIGVDELGYLGFGRDEVEAAHQDWIAGSPTPVASQS
jgi:hypothetical protein